MWILLLAEEPEVDHLFLERKQRKTFVATGISWQKGTASPWEILPEARCNEGFVQWRS